MHLMPREGTETETARRFSDSVRMHLMPREGTETENFQSSDYAFFIASYAP